MGALIAVAEKFLLASGVAYYCCAALPKPATKFGKIAELGFKTEAWILEKLGMAIMGTILLINLLWFNNNLFWMALGVIYVFASLLSYFGYVKWNVLWRDEVSSHAQMVMFAWDLGIALTCFLRT